MYAQDRVATTIITVGGFLVLGSVLGICVYLLAEAWPLFRGGHVEAVSVGRATETGSPLVTRLDESGVLEAALRPDGRVRVTAVGTGEVIDERVAVEGKRITAASLDDRTGGVALGLSDGSIELGSLGFESGPVRSEGLTEAARSLAVGGVRGWEREGVRGLIERVSEEQWRFTALSWVMGTAVALEEGAGRVVRIDSRSTPQGQRFVVAMREDGAAVVATATTVRPLGGGEPRTRLSTRMVEEGGRGLPLPEWVFVTNDGQSVFMVWRDGRLERYAAGAAGERIARAERTTIAGGGVTAAGMLLGGQTLVAACPDGRVRAFFAGRDELGGTIDRLRVVQSGEFESMGVATRLAMSPRSRLLAAGSTSGIVLRHMTSGKELARVALPGGEAPASLAFSGKEELLLASSASGERWGWRIDAGHVEASARVSFGRMRYEGEAGAQYVYQSSAGDDAAEMKLSLVPLIWGTLKATLVAMVFAVPIGVLGAVYTSEFMSPGLRRVVKPTIELMASLPSVVLGFVAAMVAAPLVAEHLPRVVAALVGTPMLIAVGAHAWAIAPKSLRARVASRWQLGVIAVAGLAAAAASWGGGGVMERILFGPSLKDVWTAAGSVDVVPMDQRPAFVLGRTSLSPSEARRLRWAGMYLRDGEVVRPKAPAVPVTRPAGSMRSWLDGEYGSAFPGWFVLLILPGVGVTWVVASRGEARRGSGTSGGGQAFARFLAVVATGVGLAAGAAWGLSAIEVDARDSILGPFSTRNTLVVGLVMGFAVVPIVYTISEDALRAVPQPLRSASLGVGATPWQTALRVVLPAASSGVFSACMIGLGRAVGETMIVLMATGNTPEISANLFSGLRSLAANIAVELPEAASGSTHYRTLVLCGLVLFALTIVINTSAEVVRQRVRKRLAAL